MILILREYKLYSDDQDLNSFCGLINYWSFDGNANDVVGSADMINGANAAFTNDRNNASLSAVDLNFGYYTIPPGSYSYGKTWTVSFWIFCKSTGKWPRVIDFINAPDNDNIIIFFHQNNYKIGVCIYNSLIRLDVKSDTDLNASIWNHVSFVKNLNQMSLYINGVLQNSPTTQGKTFANITKGSNYLGKTNKMNDYINAKIDDLKIFDIAMNSSQIIQNMDLNLKRI